MEMLVFGGGAALLLFSIWLLVNSKARNRQAVMPILAPGVMVNSAPLLTETDVLLYNLMRLAVQDHYLVFAQVPLWAFLSVEALGQARTHVLHNMALKRVDFALVHPGSRLVEKVVQLEDAFPRPHQLDRQRVIESVLDAAGIKLVKLRPQKTYTVPALSALLGLEPEE